MLIKPIIATVAMFAMSQVIADDETFQKLDIDASGAITVEEAVAMDGLQEAMAEFDANGDRELDKAEFALLMETMEARKAAS